MRVFWTDAALNQLESIRDYLAQTSPEYAHKIAERLVKRSEQMGAFPYSGRMVPGYEISEVRQVIESSYRIIYLIKEDQLRCWRLFTRLAENCLKMNSYWRCRY